MSKTLVANTNLATAPANSVKANASGSAAQPTDLSVGTLQFVGNVGAGLAAVTLSGSNGISLTTNNNSLIVSQTSSGVPTGSIIVFPVNNAPEGWLQCNGDIVPNGTGTVQGRTANFSALYALLGSIHGAAGQLPDLRGYFVRGSGTNVDGTASGAFAAKRPDSFASHTHTGSTDAVGNHTHYYDRTTGAGDTSQGLVNSPTAANAERGVNVNGSTTGAGGAHSHSITLNSTGGSETAPKNIPLLYCIKI